MDNQFENTPRHPCDSHFPKGISALSWSFLLENWNKTNVYEMMTYYTSCQQCRTASTVSTVSTVLTVSTVSTVIARCYLHLRWYFWYLHISMFFSVCFFVLFSIYLLSFFTLKSTILLCLDILLNVLARQTTRQYSENPFDHLQNCVHFETLDEESTNAGNYFIAKCWTNSLVMFMNKCNIRCVIYENQYLETNFVWRPPL